MQTNKQATELCFGLFGKWFDAAHLKNTKTIVAIQAGNIKITMSPPHFKRLYNNSKYLTCLMALQIPGFLK